MKPQPGLLTPRMFSHCRLPLDFGALPSTEGTNMKPCFHLSNTSVTLFTALSAAFLCIPAAATELVGFALMPANTFAVGPTSGQFAGPGAGGNALPLVNKQPVQGVSAVLHGPTDDSFYVMPDNGFGAKANSADALLRIYALRP